MFWLSFVCFAEYHHIIKAHYQEFSYKGLHDLIFSLMDVLKAFESPTNMTNHSYNLKVSLHSSLILT